MENACNVTNSTTYLEPVTILERLEYQKLTYKGNFVILIPKLHLPKISQVALVYLICHRHIPIQNSPMTNI